MPGPALLILYVDDPLASADFHVCPLGHAPIGRSPTFAMLPDPDGHRLRVFRPAAP